MESEVRVKSGSNILGSSVNIGDLPSLVGTSSSGPHSDLLSFSILTDIKDLLVVGIDEYCLGVSELLPPTSVGFPNLQSIGFS